MFSFIYDKRAEQQIKRIYDQFQEVNFRPLAEKLNINPVLFSTFMHRGLQALTVQSLQDQLKFFDYLDISHSLGEINKQFQFTDTDFVQLVLDTLVRNNLLEKTGEQYHTTKFLKQKLPNIEEDFAAFSTMPFFKDAIEQYSEALPHKMRGSATSFLAKAKPYVWDEALTRNDIYEHLRYITMLFGGALRKQGRFLDVGCGNGNGTVNIWYYYYLRNYFTNSKKKIQLYGIDPTRDLLKLAKNEFPTWLANKLKLDKSVILRKYGHTFPIFQEGKTHSIPYEDNFFDVVYISQVLHFDNYEKGFQEMLRVVKPGGMVIGNEFYDDYGNILIRTVDGAAGLIQHKDYAPLLTKIKAKNIRLFGLDFFTFFRYAK